MPGPCVAGDRISPQPLGVKLRQPDTQGAAGDAVSFDSTFEPVQIGELAPKLLVIKPMDGNELHQDTSRAPAHTRARRFLNQILR